MRGAIPVAIVRGVVVPSRSAWAFLILAVGLVAVVFLPATYAACLGPLGVTGVQCAAATKTFPSIGFGIPVLAASVLLAAVVGIRELLIPLASRIAALAIGAALASGAYLGLRPTSWTDAISTGEVITVALPLDVGALATAAVLGGSMGLIVAWLIGRRRAAAELDQESP